MGGMDAGPGTDLGTLGWFLGVWVVMMAAMMFPSVAPTVALYARLTKRRLAARTALFAAGYLLDVGGRQGCSRYGIFAARAQPARRRPRVEWRRPLARGRHARRRGRVRADAAQGRLPGKCRSPLGFLLGSWRDGLSGALKMGARHGAWCIGCCWALMASLFALGVMSIAWMAFIAALIAVEKMLPWGRVATYSTAALLLVLGVLVVAAPGVVRA